MKVHGQLELAGVEVVAALPITDLFVGREVWLSTDFQKYIYYDAAWNIITTGEFAFIDPMTTLGDMIFRNGPDPVDTTRLGIGSDGQILTVNVNVPEWQDNAAYVVTTRGDTIIGDASGDQVRLPIGTAGQILTSDGTDVSWEDNALDIITTRGDLIYGDATNEAARLPVGTAGQVLTTDGTDVAWMNNPAGFPDPMTTRGDIIYRDPTNITDRLAIGTANQVLTSDGIDVSWAAPNPLTTRGDLLYRDSSNVDARLPIGTAAQVLTSDGTDISWDNIPAGFGDPMTTRGDIIYRDATNTTTRLGAGTAGQIIISNGTDIAWADPVGAVSSVFGRTGDVVAVSGDYDADEIDDAATTNKFATQAELDQIALNTNGNPTLDGQALVSTIAGTRSWETLAGKRIINIDNTDSPVTGEIGAIYLVDTTSGPVTVNLPLISSIAALAQEVSYMEFLDVSGTFNTNNLILQPDTGDSVSFGIADEEWEIDLDRTTVKLFRNSGTNWALGTTLDPTAIDSLAGQGGTNYVANGYFERNIADWEVVSGEGALSANIVTPLQGVRSLDITNNFTTTRFLVSGVIDPIDPVYYGKQIGFKLSARGVGTGSVDIRIYNVTEGAVVPGKEWTATADASGRLNDINTVITGTEDTLQIQVEDTGSGVNGDVWTIDVVDMDPEGTGQGSVNGWPSYDYADGEYTITPTNGTNAINAMLTPFKDPSSGRWFLHGLVDLEFTVANNDQSFEISGIEAVARRQSVPATSDGSSKNINAFTDPSTLSINEIGSFSNSTTAEGTFDFVIQLTGKPTWATKSDLGVQLLNAGQIYQTARARFYLASNTAYTANTVFPFDTQSTLLSKQGDITNTAGVFTLPTGTWTFTSGIRDNAGTLSNAAMRLYKNGVSAVQMATDSGSTISGNVTVDATPTDVFSIRVNSSFTAFGGDADSWVEIKAYQSSTGNQPVGAGTSLLLNETPQGVIIIGQTETIVLVNEGTQNMNGTIRFTRFGNEVFYCSDGPVTHDINATPASGAGVVPEDYRPTGTSKFNTIYYDEDAGTSIQIQANGNITFVYRNESGTVSRTNSTGSISGNYSIF